MTAITRTELPHRALVALSGEDRVAFLQGLVSADVTKAGPERALYGAYLTPQGKFLFDFFLLAVDDRLLLEVEAARREDFIARLRRFRLRSKVALDAFDDWRVYGFTGDRGPPPANGVLFADPRLPAAGARGWMPPAVAAALGDAVPHAVWDRARIALGLPDGSRDLVVEKTLLLEGGFDELQGVDWQKGCFLGQEVTARSKYRGQIKKRLVPVAISGPPPAPGTMVLAAGQEVGEMRSHQGDLGLAILRLDALAQPELIAGDARLHPRPPAWMR